MSDLKNIKNILSDFEMEYDPNEWSNLEKDLPKPKQGGHFRKITVIASAAAIFVAAIITVVVLNKNYENQEKIATETEKNNEINRISTEDNYENLQTEPIDKDIINNKQSNQVVNTDPMLLNTDPANIPERNVGAVEKKNQAQESSDIIANTSDNNTPDVINIHKEISSGGQEKNNTNSETLSVKYVVEMIEECSPAKVILSASDLPAGYEIYWNMGDGTSYVGNVVEHTYLDAGDYYPVASVVNENFVIKKDKIRKISVKESTFVRINFENIKNNYRFTFYPEDKLQALWNIDGKEFNYTDVEYTFPRSGKYNIYLSVINEVGCRTTASEIINVDIEPVYYVPNAFIPGVGDGVNSYFGPIGEDLDFKSYRLTIIDLNGNFVFESGKVEEMWNGKINNTGLDAKGGYYLWEIKTVDWYNNIHSRKGRVNLIRE
ncbi:MAG: gliding motility-associated C-terminal domain-containing protein [Bacteroidales bacterium]|jgi:hypothetical protein|nr:gliding motility-associated C-terminal domain-containing protein [Bacteroidales bacterium]